MDDTTSSRDGLLTTAEAAAHLGTSTAYIYKLVYLGKLRPERLLGRILFRRDALDALDRRTLSLALL